MRLYRNYDPDVDQNPIQLVSAFRGLTETVQVRHGAGTGMVMDWKQSAGVLLLGGDSRVIKVWDAQTETQNAVRPLLSSILIRADPYSRTLRQILTAP